MPSPPLSISRPMGSNRLTSVSLNSASLVLALLPNPEALAEKHVVARFVSDLHVISGGRCRSKPCLGPLCAMDGDRPFYYGFLHHCLPQASHLALPKRTNHAPSQKR